MVSVLDETKRVGFELRSEDHEITSATENLKLRSKVVSSLPKLYNQSTWISGRTRVDKKEDVDQTSSSVDLSSFNEHCNVFGASEVDSYSSDNENNRCTKASSRKSQKKRRKAEGTDKKRVPWHTSFFSYLHGLRKSHESLKDIDLLLIGKTGTGKSRTGNTILQRDVFTYTDSCTSETQDVQHEYVQHNDRRIKVVDCPGIEDTSNMEDVEKTTTYLIEKMGDAIFKHPDGYHAFLLVVRYGGKFTKEDKCVIKTLKSIFGEEIISQFSILLITHGDWFEVENETNKSFKQWCSEQTGVIKELMEECGNRVILFDNRTNDPGKRDLQMNELIQTIDKLQYQGMRYNHEYFQRAVKNREHLLVAVKEPRILEETVKECSIIQCDLEKLNNDFSNKCIEKMWCLKQRAFEIKKKVQEEDNRTGALIKVVDLIDSSYRFIANRLQLLITLKKKESDLLAEKKSLIKLHEEQYNVLKESYEKERNVDIQRIEIDKKEMQERWLKQKGELEADLKLTSDSIESDINDCQLKMEELKIKCQEMKEDNKNQVNDQITELQYSIHKLKELKTKKTQDIQEELNRMSILQNEEQMKHSDRVIEELKNNEVIFLKKQNKLINQHAAEIKIFKEKEEKHIQEKQKMGNDLKTVEEANVALKKELLDLQNLHFQKTSSFLKRMKNLCAVM